ncbi:4Fe-4S binding protein [Methanosphaerula palustris]|nr:4Fe-4S binding protein [Methanosphaerula palustris]
MTSRESIRKGLGVLIGAAGLAYPVCAAVCPRGKGDCPYPGKCFLYTDMDTNSICDYTRSSTSSSGSSSSVAVQTTSATPTPGVTTATTTTTTTSVPVSPGPNTLGLLPFSALLAGVLAFIVATAVLFIGLRSGRFGGRTPGPGPALALSSFFGLGAAEIVTYLLMDQNTSASLFAAVYLLAGTVLTAYAWRGGALSRTIVLGLAVMSVLFGFVFLAPLMPIEFVGLVGLVTGTQTLTPGIIGILGGIGLALITGRTFCGHICPVGSIQELAYTVPVKKITSLQGRYLEILRGVIAVASVVAGMFLVSIMEYTGVYDFFSLTLSTGFLVFAGLLIISAFIYRPVCRGLCPFGLIFSIPSHFSRYRLRRTGSCITCKKCEKVCPAQVAGRDASRRECYLCGRCSDVCPVEGALVYSA